jgi:hypothetical protein
MVPVWKHQRRRLYAKSPLCQTNPKNTGARKELEYAVDTRFPQEATLEMNARQKQ